MYFTHEPSDSYRGTFYTATDYLIALAHANSTEMDIELQGVGCIVTIQPMPAPTQMEAPVSRFRSDTQEPSQSNQTSENPFKKGNLHYDTEPDSTDSDEETDTSGNDQIKHTCANVDI
jgi:hypothetical protein